MTQEDKRKDAYITNCNVCATDIAALRLLFDSRCAEIIEKIIANYYECG